MGYSIQYGADSHVETAWKRKAGRKYRRYLMVFAVFVTAAIFAFSGGKKGLEDMLIPGNPEVTKAAFSQLADDLREGNPLKEALVTFCREIIGDAAVSG